MLRQQMGGANCCKMAAALSLLLLLQLVIVAYVQAGKATPSLGEII